MSKAYSNDSRTVSGTTSVIDNASEEIFTNVSTALMRRDFGHCGDVELERVSLAGSANSDEFDSKE